jgi:hypothetical protein
MNPEEIDMPDSRTPDTASTENGAPEAADAPLNRAERRAHAKGRKPVESKSKAHITGHQRLGGGPRQWTNRRGGG